MGKANAKGCGERAHRGIGYQHYMESCSTMQVIQQLSVMEAVFRERGTFTEQKPSLYW